MRSVAPRPASLWAPPARRRARFRWPSLRVPVRGDVLLAVILLAASLLGTAWAAASPGSPRVGSELGALAVVMLGLTLFLSGWSALQGRALAGLAAGGRIEDGAQHVAAHGRWFAGWFATQHLAWSALGMALAAVLLLPRGAAFDLTLATVGGLLAVAVCALTATLSAGQPLLTGQAAALAACWRSPIPHGVTGRRAGVWVARGVALLLLPSRLAQVRRWDGAQPQPFLRKIVQVTEDARRGRAGYLLDVRPAPGVSWRAELPQRAAVYLVIWALGAVVALIALRAGLIAPIIPALTALTGADPLAQTAESQAAPTPEAGAGSNGGGGGGGGGGNQGGGQSSGSASGAGASGQGQDQGEGSDQSDGSASGDGSAGDGPGNQGSDGAGSSGGGGGSSGQSQGAGEQSGQQGEQGQQAGQQGQSDGQGQGAGQQQGSGQQGQQGQGQSGGGQEQQGQRQSSPQDQQGAGASGGEQETGGQQAQGQGSQGQSQGDQSEAQGGGAQQPDQGEGSGGGGGRQEPQAQSDDTQQGESEGGSDRPGDGAGGPGSTRGGDPVAPPTPPQLGAPTPVQPPAAQSTDDVVSIELPAFGPGQQAQGTPQPFPGAVLPAQPGQAGPQGPNASGTAAHGSRSAGQPLPPWIQSLLDGAGSP